MNKRFKAIKYILLASIVMMLSLGLTFKADTGPKPALYITINNIDSDIYVTLLANRESSGPYSEVKEDSYRFSELSEIDLKFYEYAKSSDYYFWGISQKLDKENNTFSWTYYPPDEFLVLCYIEDSDAFVITDKALSRYAFSSYFEMNLVNESGVYTFSNIRKNYNYALEIMHFMLRVIITLAVEMALAYFLCGFRGKAFIVILVANILTQVGLNVFLNIIHVNSMLQIIFYAFLEVMVMVVEMVIYLIALRKIDKKYKVGIIVLYTVLANLLSFGLGLVLFKLFPGVI